MGKKKKLKHLQKIVGNAPRRRLRLIDLIEKVTSSEEVCHSVLKRRGVPKKVRERLQATAQRFRIGKSKRGSLLRTYGTVLTFLEQNPRHKASSLMLCAALIAPLVPQGLGAKEAFLNRVQKWCKDTFFVLTCGEKKLVKIAVCTWSLCIDREAQEKLIRGKIRVYPESL